MLSLALVSLLAPAAYGAAVSPRSTAPAAALSIAISDITPGATNTYSYPIASDAGAPQVTALAGLSTPGNPDLNAFSQYGRYKHVVVLSWDGFHQSDLDMYVATTPGSALGSVLDTALEYTNATTSSPSDSFPGAQAYMTGASARTHGVYYDVAYDRTLYAPGSDCSGPMGATVAYDETIDNNSSDVTGGGGINPMNLPMSKNAWGGCVPVYPHNYVRVNNMFEIARFNGLFTAYTDKHPAYSIANGPSGLGLSEGYFPEINPFGTVGQVESYDDLHWSALQNWTLGLHANGSAWPEAGGAPALYGGNFQAYSVAEKSSGYNPDGTFASNTLQAVQFLDGKLGSLIATMKTAGTYDDTLLIITAKHGQSPIDRSTLIWVNPDSLVNATGVAVPGLSADDGAYMWLANGSDATQAKAGLLANKEALGIEEVWIFDEVVANGFGDPRYDSRAPDVVVKTKVGVIYTTGSGKKSGEHGGLNPDDKDVLLIVSNPLCITPGKSSAKVSTRQVAPTALKALGLDPLFLEGVRAEGTPLLPGLQY